VTFGQDGVFAELKRTVEKGLGKAGLILFMQLDNCSKRTAGRATFVN
jgi:hypothetical protein